MKKTNRMKLTLTIVTLFILFSCENPAEKSNERIETSIFKKVKEIQQNYNQYKNDITNSGFTTLLSFDQSKQEESRDESKRIIKKAESILTTFNQNNQILVSDLKILFNSIQPTKKINAKEIEQMKSKFDESIEITKSNYILDSTVLVLSKDILGVLENCNYEIKEGNPEFESMDCVFEYNDKVIKLNQIQMEAKTNFINKLLK